MAEHAVIKPEKIAQTAATLLEKQLVVPAAFQRQGIDQFKGAKDDTINITVPGVLPYRTYGWRNDRSAPINFDEYAERKVAITFGGDIYSGVHLTDEQNDMDMDGWGKLAQAQTKAIGTGLEQEAISYLLAAPYEVTLGIPSLATDGDGAMRAGLLRARSVARKLSMPEGRKVILVSGDWEADLLSDDKLNLASSVGEGEAVSALRDATIGRRFGFDIVVAPELPDDTAIVMVDSAFQFLTGAPSVPQSVPFGATAAYEGVALTWIRDYDTAYRRDRSVFNTYKGFQYVDDPLVGIDGTDQAYVSDANHFVRAFALKLDGADSLPDGSLGRAGENAKFTATYDNELAHITGLGTAV